MSPKLKNRRTGRVDCMLILQRIKDASRKDLPWLYELKSNPENKFPHIVRRQISKFENKLL